MLGEHGLWWKSAMYESAVAVPLIVAGPDVPAGKVAGTNAMLVDVFPSILEAVGTRPVPEDRNLPGRSLWALAREDAQPRTAFSEYHAIFSPSGIFMIRTARYKYVHYVGYPPDSSIWPSTPRRRATWRPTRPTPMSGPRASGSSGPSAIRRPWTGAPGPISAAASTPPAAPPRCWRRG